MEPTQTRKFKSVLIIGALLVSATAAVFFWIERGLQSTPLSRLISAELPILDLRLEFVSSAEEPIPPEETRLGAAAGAQGQGQDGRTLETGDDDCPELVGGDTSEGTRLSEDKKRGKDCSQTARWVVKRHPIAFTLSFQDGRKVLELFEGQTAVSRLFESRFVQGLFFEPLHSANVRAEDLKLEGLQGAFLKQFIAEALKAHAELHYDIAHGRKGFVFSFVRGESHYVSSALPVMARALARSGYRVPALREPVLEMRIGLQRLFLTESEGRIYLANGLEALINVLESLPSAHPPKVDAPMVLTARSEAFVANLLPVMVGEASWELRLAFGLPGDSFGTLELAAGKLTQALRPAIFRGVPAGIPHDVFAALVTSYHLSPQMTTEDWQRLATQGPGSPAGDAPREGGIAVLWDLDAQTPGATNMGVVIANQTHPDEVGQFKAYFRKEELTAECGGGTVFLAATSPKLLLRMRESCGGQSLSILDWERGSRAKDWKEAQLLMFMNPGEGMRQLFLAGGAAEGGSAGEFEPDWKQQYERAKEIMRRESEEVFGSLPILAHWGTASPAAKVVHLKGFTVKQGAAR